MGVALFMIKEQNKVQGVDDIMEEKENQSTNEIKEK